ncbi:MAG: gliding motility-associated C-terminal domain-containing protein, partial [Flavobacteriales bacterium]
AGAGFSLSSTVGEPATTTLKGNTVMLTQGFQQPSSVDSIMELHIYNAFSPNGDNINDTWFIDGIEKHPDNTVTIFNRWGIEVWKGIHYDNVDVVWNGTNSAGAELPSATYFYIIRAANTRKSSGWVQLLK